MRIPPDCTPDEIAREVWAQLKQTANDWGRLVLTDELLHSWQLDPGMIQRNGRFANKDPLVLPSVGAWANQPDVATAIPNLVLAGDYPKGEWEVANMEAANHNARNSVNALLHAAGSRESPCKAVSHTARRNSRPSSASTPTASRAGSATSSTAADGTEAIRRSTLSGSFQERWPSG